jgi:hypothetical protein
MNCVEGAAVWRRKNVLPLNAGVRVMATRISVENIKPGMLLARPIVNKHQKEIFPIGTKLTEYHRTFFKNGGLQFVVIDHDSEPVDSTIDSESRALATQRVNKRIRWKPSNPMEEEIYQLALQSAEHSLSERRSK